MYAFKKKKMTSWAMTAPVDYVRLYRTFKKHTPSLLVVRESNGKSIF